MKGGVKAVSLFLEVCLYLHWKLKSLESCDKKKFQVPMDNSWFFKATPTVWLCSKINIDNTETKATFWKWVYLIVKIQPSSRTCSMLFWGIFLFLYDPNLLSLTDARHRNWTLFTSPESWRSKWVRNDLKQCWLFVGILHHIFMTANGLS